MGESGENSNTWFTDAISLVEENGVGWAWWPLKKMGSNNPLEVKVNPGYQAILDYWNGTGEKPTAEDAYNGLMQLTENIKLENNIYHKDVVDAMIRQPHSEETVPFKNHTIAAGSNTLIYATDFDMGRADIAYHDAEVTNTSGNAGGVAWNQGYAYRNDGVDIQPSEDDVTNGYNVGWTETGEWLQYTVNVEEEGLYTVGIRTASTGTTGKISLLANEYKITESISLPNTGGYQTWETTTVEDVYLKSGKNTLKINIDEGGFNLNYLEFSKQAAAASEQPKVLDGTFNHGEKVIHLVFNQPFSAISSDAGFTVNVNDTEAAIAEVKLLEGQEQIITITLSEAVYYGDKVSVSYAGTTVATSLGVALSPFSDVEVAVLSENKILDVPGKIQMEDFTVNSGFEFETTTDSGGGQNAGYTDSGDYFDFSVMVNQTGYYTAAFRVASLSAGGSLKLQLVKEDGTTEDLTSVTFNATGGWQTWKSIASEDLYLEEGFHTLRVLAQSASFNINWFSLSYLYEEIPLGINDLAHGRGVAFFPNPSTGTFNIKFGNAAMVPEVLTFYDLTGNEIYSFHPQKGVSQYKINSPLKKGFFYVAFELNGKRLTQKLMVN